MIVIVDACSGNLRSVERALQQVGGEVRVSRDPDVVRKADQIVVPGQGAFAMFMQGLAEHDLGEALREAIASGRPYLGICLGLQILFDRSVEHGATAGLGVFAGDVEAFVPSGDLKVPHMGWNTITPPVAPPPGSTHEREPLLAGLPADPYVYFVHSYHAVPRDRAIVALEAEHGQRFCAAVRRDNVFACQFHPEKSQGVGLAILKNFVDGALP
ncbi:MAG: imidazole glycerol phosphate synthase subunit HisH [Proteobacteria bacterium]|nr:imidazole glycerol phosphate synthase subunit HisH [Pseudomonadota bacterium]